MYLARYRRLSHALLDEGLDTSRKSPSPLAGEGTQRADEGSPPEKRRGRFPIGGDPSSPALFPQGAKGAPRLTRDVSLMAQWWDSASGVAKFRFFPCKPLKTLKTTEEILEKVWRPPDGRTNSTPASRSRFRRDRPTKAPEIRTGERPCPSREIVFSS